MRAVLWVIVAVSLGVSSEAQTLSPEAWAVASRLMTNVIPEAPGSDAYMDWGVKRFPNTGTITWRALSPTSRQATHARNATRFWAYVFQSRGIPFAFVEVPATDTTAQITFQYANSFTFGGVTYPVGCGNSPAVFEADRLTYALAWVNANTRSGCDGMEITLHELGHLLIWQSHLEFGINAKQFGSLAPKWDWRLTPEQNAQRVGWEGVTGLYEAMAWVYSVPVGSVP